MISNSENRPEGTGAIESGSFEVPAAGENVVPGASSPGHPGPTGAPPVGGTFSGFLELVYGVLFEPVQTMRKVAERPPLVLTVLIVTILSLLGTLMGLLTASKVVGQSLLSASMGQLAPVVQALIPLGAVLGLLWGYLKWLGYSAVLHLIADLLGGRGSARGVFAAAGLAVLPSILLVPVEFMAYRFASGAGATTLTGLASLAVAVWSLVLLVIGVREVHGLSNGRAALVVFSPLLAFALLIILILAALVFVAASLPAGMHFPGYF